MRNATFAENPAAPPKGSAAVPQSVAAAATSIVLRPRQRLALGGEEEIVYVVQSGVLLLESQPRLAVRQIVDLYYPGDIVRSRSLPPLPALALVAGGRAEVARLSGRKLQAMCAADSAVMSWADAALAGQYARRLLHVATIGALTGEERLASLLYELVMRTGERGMDKSWTFDLPLSRTDMANYLSLNADTLSRMMSRLKQAGVLATTGRGRGFTPELEALGTMSPLAEALRTSHAPPAG